MPTTTIHGTNTPDNTHITMTHVGYNAKGFKQYFMYVSELLSHADTVGITETWLRPGKLAVIKPTLLGSPALNNVKEVQAHLYKSICQPVLTYGMECMSNSKDQFRRMESIQGRLINQCLGLSKRSHNSAVLKALKIDKAQNIVNRNVLNLYHRIFKIDSPARSLMQFLLARYITGSDSVGGGG